MKITPQSLGQPAKANPPDPPSNGQEGALLNRGQLTRNTLDTASPELTLTQTLSFTTLLTLSSIMGSLGHHLNGPPLLHRHQYHYLQQ